MDDIFKFRYRERFNLSARQLEDEPVEEIRKARLIWALDKDRVKLEEERQARH